VGSSINEFSKQLPQYRDQLVEQFSWVLHKLQALNIQISKEQVLAYFDPGMALSMTTNMLSGVGNVMANLFLIILTIVFMLFEAQSLPKKLHLALDDPDMRLQQIDRFLQSVNQYMVIKTLVSLATGLIVGIGLAFIGVDYALLWAVIAFLFNYIPNIGSIIAAIPAVLLAFIQLGPAAAGGTALLYIGANMVMGNVVEPKFMGSNYDAAVITGGHCGFGMGATPTAVMNMGALVSRTGPSPQAFMVVPIVGAFFIDIVNLIVLQGYLSFIM